MCLLPTASGDPEAQIDRFYRAFEPLGCELSHVSLFRLGSHPLDLREHLLSRDVIYVGGGSMLNLLALWRVHGVDSLLAEAWQKGVALVGVSAGSMCWFEAGITRTRGAPGPGDRPGPAAVDALGARRQPTRSAAPSTARASRRACPAASRSRTAWGCCSTGDELAEAVTRAARARAPTGSRSRARRWWSGRSSRGC